MNNVLTSMCGMCGMCKLEMSRETSVHFLGSVGFFLKREIPGDILRSILRVEGDLNSREF